MNIHKIFAVALLALTSACARDLNSSSYTSSSTSGVVLEGTIISARIVNISESDRLGGNGNGALAGGLAGGVAGSTIGGGKGAVLAAVGGALIGAAAGSVAQDELGKSDGMEYIIKIKSKNEDAYAPKVQKTVGKKAAANISESKTEMISVVQGKENPLTAGQKVFVIYSDDRPRVVPQNQAIY